MSSILKVDTLQDVNGNAIISSDGSGNLSIPNLTTTGDINFGDNDKAQFGASNDLQIYHDGSNSYIKDVGTGNLTVQGDQYVILRGATGEYLSGSDGAAVSIKYNGAEKLATTSTGIDVTGSVDANGLDINGSNSSGIIAEIRNSDSTQTGGAILDFKYGNTLTGRIQNRFDGSSFRTDFYGGVNGLRIYADEAKTQERITANSGNVVINETSDDVDFRVESNNNTHALFVQGSDGNVGIGTSSPTALLTAIEDVSRSALTGTGVGQIHISGGATPADNDVSSITFSTNNTTTASSIIGSQLTNNGSNLFFGTSGNYAAGVNNTAMFINYAGNVGIGTTSPSSTLDVAGIGTFKPSGTTSLKLLNLALNSGSSSGTTGLYLGDASSGINVLTREKSSINTASVVIYGENGFGVAQERLKLNVNSTVLSTGSNERMSWTNNEAVINDASNDYDFRVESNNSTHMLFVDAGTDRVGIGQSSPAHTLHVTGGPPSGTDLVLFNNSRGSGTPRGFQLLYSALAPDDGNIAFNFEDSSTTRFRVNNDGDVLNHDGTYGTISDQRIKQNITDANSQWEDIKALSFKNFKKKDDVAQYGEENAPTELGLIAQELELTSPNLVKEYPCDKKTSNLHPDFIDWENSTIKGVKYSILYMKAVKALQEAMLKIEDLEARVNTLEGN